MFDKLLPGLWRVAGGTRGYGDLPVLTVKGDCNVYVVQLADAPILVDCATVPAKPLVEANIREAGFDPDDLTDLILTHSHIDHAEAAELWRTEHGLRTHLSAVGAEYLDRSDSSLLGYVRGGSKSPFPSFQVDHRVQDDESFEVAGTAVQALFVPGHTPDTTLFTLELDGKRTGICGDFCFGPADRDPGGGGLGALGRAWKSDLIDYRESLKKALELDMEVLLPGHGWILVGAEVVSKNLMAALATVERFIATPKIYLFGVRSQE